MKLLATPRVRVRLLGWWVLLLVELLLEPRDLWVGVFWRGLGFVKAMPGVELFICLAPLLPVHVTVYVTRWPRD